MRKRLLISLLGCSFFMTSMLNLSAAADVKKYVEAAGWNIGSQSVEAVSSQLGLTAEEKRILVKGLIDGIQGKPSPIDLAKESENMQLALQTRAEEQLKRQQQEVNKIADMNKQKAAKYFKKLEKSKKVASTEKGLYYQILKPGSKQYAKAHSTVVVHYVGRLLDGTEFDSSKKRGEPARFNLQQVIPGFQDGLQLVGKGGKIRLFVPSELGYGDKQIPGIPAGSTLIFDVDMIDIETDNNA